MNPSGTNRKLLIIEFDPDLAEVLAYSFENFSLKIPSNPLVYEQDSDKSVPDLAIIEVNEKSIGFSKTFAHLVKNNVPVIFIIDYFNPVCPDITGCNEVARVTRPYKIKHLQELVLEQLDGNDLIVASCQ